MTHPFVRVDFSCLFNRRLPAARSDGTRLAIRSDSRCAYHPFTEFCYRFRPLCRAFHGRLRNIPARDEPHDRRTQFEPRAVIAIRHVRNRCAKVAHIRQKAHHGNEFANNTARRRPGLTVPLMDSLHLLHFERLGEGAFTQCPSRPCRSYLGRKTCPFHPVDE